MEEDEGEEETRLRVKPQAQEAKRVAVRGEHHGDANDDGFAPSQAQPTSKITEPVAKSSFWMSLLAFSRR